MDQLSESYLRSASLLLSPFPSLSSTTSHRLATLSTGLSDADLATRCTACRSQLIVGINATIGIDLQGGRKMHFVCRGCGGRSGRGDTDDGSKKAFGRVRRKDYRKLPTVVVAEIKTKAIPQHSDPPPSPVSIGRTTPTPTSSRSATPTPSSPATTSETAGKKKKRSKQPNGLAQLLEEKRRKTAEKESSGLKGFLAGI